MKRSFEKQKEDESKAKRVKLDKKSQASPFKDLNLPLASVEYAYCPEQLSFTRLKTFKSWLEKDVIPLFRPTFVTVFNKTYEERRRVLGFGDKGIQYNYSGREVDAIDWQDFPHLLEIRDEVLAICRLNQPDLPDPNFVLINWFRAGGDKIGPHADDERDLVPDKPIISLSLGQERRFVFHTKKPFRKCGEIMLKNGCIVIMNSGTQTHYKHGIPEMKKAKGDRWSLTFRFVHPSSNGEL